ncbi:tautomerase-like protein [Sinobacterium caligoides]|uniref:Tautomerase-like protein n=2 Tax=Sinobacterium caligoides TaxID=933926 RepID=A0A3N2D5J5_9GAMM|nr:tautomerase-like protein [Sinobacterium caligoides]
MPSVLIEVRREYSEEEESGIMEAVHSALRSSFKIKPTDRHVRLIVHKAHRFECPPDREKPEYVTHISIDCIAGRSLDAKRSLYQTIVKNLKPFGIPNNHVKIMLREITLDNWGVRGGYAACDIDLGFEVEV